MKTKIYLKLIVFLLFACGSFSGNAQMARAFGSYMKGRSEGVKQKSYWRFDIGYGFAFSSLNYQSIDRYFNPLTNTKNTIALSKSFGFNGMSGLVSSYFPLISTSEKGMVAFSLGGGGNIFNVDLGNISMDTLITPSAPATVAHILFPFSLDYKWGGEASLNKSDKVSFTIGAGVIPSLYGFTLSTNSGYNKTKFVFQPFVKAEFGFFAGIEWKIRGMYQFGTANFIDEKVGDFNLNSSPTYKEVFLRNGSTFSIGIALMPFSWDWDSDNW
jgi:hypothetical protein